MKDRSAELCMKPLADGPYCTLRVRHESECLYFPQRWKGETVEACQLCSGPFMGVTSEDAEGRLICSQCIADERDDAHDKEMAALTAAGDRKLLESAKRS